MKFYRTRYASSLAPTCYFNRIVPEGFLTTCSFDFLTDDQDTKVFVMCIFIWSYVIPLTFIVYFYSQLLKSIRNHERMLREQVGQKLRDSPTICFRFLQIINEQTSASTGKEDEREIVGVESGQGKER